MPINITDLNELDSDIVVSNEELIAGLLKTYTDSTIDLGPGSAIYRLLIGPAAILQTLGQEEWDRIRQSTTLSAAIANPSLADDDLIDSLLSNYLVERRDGQVAQGKLRLILNTSRYTPVSDGIIFSANGVSYRPTRTFAGVSTEAELLSSSDRLITPYGDQYSFVIDVAALVAGEAGNLSKGTSLRFTTEQAHIVSAIVASDLTGGSDTETNEDLLARATSGIATKSLASRTSIKALLTDKVPAVRDLSIVGAGDAEMRRDKGNTLGISSFGKADIYVRTRNYPVSEIVTKTAELQEDGYTWLITFTRDEFPGAYYVTSARSLTTGLFKPISQIERGLDSTPLATTDITPRFRLNAPDHVFTRYQTMSVSISDPGTGASPGDTANYELEVLYMPQLSDVNDLVLDRDYRHPGGDYLVRAALPCLVAMNLKIVRGPGDPEPDVELIKSDIAAAVNGVDFVEGKLSADLILRAVSPYLTGRTRCRLPIDLRGQIYYPTVIAYPQLPQDDGIYWIYDTDELNIPFVPDLSISSRTAVYCTNTNSIDIEVSASDHLPV